MVEDCCTLCTAGCVVTGVDIRAFVSVYFVMRSKHVRLVNFSQLYCFYLESHHLGLLMCSQNK